MSEKEKIIKKVLKHYPQTQAIYLFGSYGTNDEQTKSDVDIALLLEHKEAKNVGSLSMSPLQFELEDLLNKDVDLINLRQVPTVLQKEIIATNRRIYQADEYAVDLFEMLTISYFQKLNEERAGILKEVLASGRIYGQ